MTDTYHLHGLTESQAMGLFRELCRTFNWVGTVQTPGDIVVVLADQDNEYGDESDLTPAMVAAATSTYSWQKAADRMAEAGNESMPTVFVRADGTFDVEEPDGDLHRYAADGTPVQGDG